MHSIALILPMCIRSKDKLQKSADHEKRSDIIKMVTLFVPDFSLSHKKINEQLHRQHTTVKIQESEDEAEAPGTTQTKKDCLRKVRGVHFDCTTSALNQYSAIGRKAYLDPGLRSL